MKTRIYLLKAIYLVSSLMLAGIVSFLILGFGPPPPPPPSGIQTKACWLSIDHPGFLKYADPDVWTMLQCLVPFTLNGQQLSFYGNNLNGNLNKVTDFHLTVSIYQGNNGSGSAYKWSHNFDDAQYDPGKGAVYPIQVPTSGSFSITIDVVEPYCCQFDKKIFFRTMWHDIEYMTYSTDDINIQIGNDNGDYITAWQRKKCSF